MQIILKKETGQIVLKRNSRVIELRQVGRPGQPGPTGEQSVTSVAGRIGDVVLTKTDIGLSNVDNTSDANKPISIAVQAALETKQNITDAEEMAIAYGVAL